MRICVYVFIETEVLYAFYDLKCDKCNEEFNIMAKISDREAETN